MKSRKVLAALLVMGTLAAAGAALAHDGKPDKHDARPCMCGQHAHRPDFPNIPNRPNMMPQNHGGFMNFCRQFADNFRNNFNKPFGGRHNREHYQQFARFTPDMPDEIRTKTADIAKLRIDLDNVMTKRPLDRAKAVEIYTKITQLSGELKVWRFNRKLDRLERNDKPDRHDKHDKHDKKSDKHEKDDDKDDKHEKHDKDKKEKDDD